MKDVNVQQVPPKRSSEWSKRTTFMATLEAKGQRRREEEPNGDSFEGVFENDKKKSGREFVRRKGRFMRAISTNLANATGRARSRNKASTPKD